MAKTIIEQITDDIDGSANAKTVTFSFDGSEYSIDLSTKNRAALEKALKPYLDHASQQSRRSSRAPRRSRSTSPAKGQPDLGAVREWARANGHTVSDRGRVSGVIQAAFDAAHRAGASETQLTPHHG